MAYIGKKPADIIATAVDTTTGTFSGNLTVDTSTLYVDSANNRVGVGTASPNANTKLDVNGAARIGNSTDGIMIENNTGSFDIDNASYIRRDSSSGALEITSGSTTARNMIFNTKTSGAESARIDSSGNLLVGTTNSLAGINNTDTGISLRTSTGSASSIAVSRNTGVSGYFNRNSDGDILSFRKDGSAVGSIGVAASDNLYIAGATGSTKGLYFNDTSILPATTGGGTSDNAVDLGQSNVRFKDLYLSGGAYIGGTGSANYLDDYEEGTWTPELTFNQGTTGIVYNSAAGSRSGQYVKIGQFVWLWFYFILSNKGTSIGTAEINGIPFTTANSFYNENGGVAHAYSGFTGLRSNITTLVGGSNRIYLNHADANSGSITATSNLSNSQFTNGAYLRGHVCYKTAQ